MKISFMLRILRKNQNSPFIGALFLLLLFCGNAYGQHSNGYVNFSVKPFTPYFVGNMGQFDTYNSPDGSALPSYGSRMGNAVVLFNGSSVQFVETVMKNEENGDGDVSEERRSETLRQTLHFVNADPSATFEPEQKQQNYFTFPDPGHTNGTITANAWEKLICRNIYTGIDIEFSYTENGGLKYSFVIHPGADPAVIRMKWDGTDHQFIDANGDLKMNSGNGLITDKAPSTFYLDDHSSVVTSSFSLNGKSISFSLGNYDHTKTLVIDPWILSPNLIGNNKAYDIQHDASGNIYCYGGTTPYQLQKYSSTGSPLWTYNTNAPGYYGDFTIDASGNAYCIYGPWGDECVKLNSAGVLIWDAPVVSNVRETYRIYPNPQTGQLEIMGIEVTQTGQVPIVLNMDPGTGALSPSFFHSSCTKGESRCMAVDANGDAFGLVFAAVISPDTVSDNLLWKVNALNTTIGSVVDGYKLVETDTSATDTYFSGYNGITVGCFVFTYDGETVKKRDKANLVLLDSVSVPGGLHYKTGGICLDACGNVYVGGPNSIIEYDINLLPITSVTTGAQVYDVNLGNTPGEILACGDGFFGSFTFPVASCSTGINVTTNDASACACNGSATISILSACTADHFTYHWLPYGGDSATATNLCAGTYTVVSTNMTTGVIDSTVVTINGTPSTIVLSANITDAGCNTSTGAITVNASGGTGPYTYLWFASGATTSTISNLPGGVYLVEVTDANGCAQIQSFTVPPLPITVEFSLVQPICTMCNGTATATPAGGTGPYTFSWNTIPTQTTQTATALCTGTYSVTITDSTGCSSVDTVNLVSYNQPPPLTISASDLSPCVDDAPVSLTGTPSGGTWSGTAVLPGFFYPYNAGVGPALVTYSYTDANGCFNATSITINVDACTGIHEQDLFNSFSIFPNPNNGTFTLTSNADAGDLNMTISDAAGRVVYSSVEKNVKAGFTKQMDLENLSSGLYLVKLVSAHGQSVERISIVR